MRFLIDLNLSPEWARVLQEARHEAEHWRDLGALTANDVELMAYARLHNYIVLTHDLDFGMLLHATGAEGPSVVQLRMEEVRPAESATLLLQALSEAESALRQGALVSVEPRRRRIRLLPLRKQRP